MKIKKVLRISLSKSEKASFCGLSPIEYQQ